MSRSALGVHHLGINVSDVEEQRARLVAAGFEAGEIFRIDNAASAVGNGIQDIDMSVCFLRRGDITVEVIAHNGPGVSAARGAPAAGATNWVTPGLVEVAGELRPAGDSPSTGRSDHMVLTWWTADPVATADLLRALGLRHDHDGWAFPGGLLRLERAEPETTPPDVRAVGRTHVSFRFADAVAMHASLEDQGFDCVSTPVNHEDVIFWFFVRDPGGGGAVEVIQDNDRLLG